MYGSTPGAGAGQAIFTDDVSLQVFMEHLKRLVGYFLFCPNFTYVTARQLRLSARKRLESFAVVLLFFRFLLSYLSR